MPAFNSFTVNDRETSPVAHVFTPRSRKDAVATYVKSTGVPVGDERFTISLRETADKFRARITMSLPVVVTETVNGVASPVVARTARASVDLSFDKESTLQERKNAIGLLANSLAAANSQFDGVLTGLEEIY